MNASGTEVRELWGHPAGLYVCFATEMWERFSFYGMKYLLLLYLTKYHLFTDVMGLDVLGSYAALVYAAPVLGGLIADRWLGMRKSVTFGACMLVLGHLAMAWEGEAAHVAGSEIVRDESALAVLYVALALIVVGVGFLKPNISTLVGRLYPAEDQRRDAGFTIFYMGINLGALAATLGCGYLGETLGWRYGFGAAGIGMVFGLLIFLGGQRFLYGMAEAPSPDALNERMLGIPREWLIYLAGVAAVPILALMLQDIHVVEYSLNTLALLVAGGLVWFIIARCDALERDRMLVLAVLIFSSVVFWALFEQSAASMTLYTDRLVNRSIFGIEFTASQFGSLNPLFIITLAPLFALLWSTLEKRGLQPSTPVKFSLGVMQAGLGFGALVIGARMPEASGQIAAIWMILAHLLHTTGELCLSPVGLAAVTRLAVHRVVGLMMGVWFLATAYSEYVAAQLAKLAAVETTPGSAFDATAAVQAYDELFVFLLKLGLGVGFALLVVSPWLTRRMHGLR